MPTFTNQASLTYNGVTVNSNIVTGEITQSLEVTKTAVNADYRAGGQITYVVNLRNTGTADYTGLTVTDDLGTNDFGTGTVTPLTFTGEPVLYLINGIQQTAPAVTAGPPLTVTGVSVPAGGSTQLIYSARANQFAPIDGTEGIVNTATVTGGGLSEAITDTATVTPDLSPNLSIVKALNPTNVQENSEITYTFTIQNTGTTAATGATVSDTFNPILNAPLSVTLNGAPLALGTGYTYNAATGQFDTVAGAITVPAATVTRNPDTGVYSITPGEVVLSVTGTV